MPVNLYDLVPELSAEDRGALEKLWEARAEHRWGLGERPAVVVVDMTRAFVEDGYPTGWAATGEPCANAIADLLEVARPAGLPVFFSVTEPLEGAAVGAWMRGRSGSSAFPYNGPAESHEIVDVLKPEPGDVVFSKPKPSAFFASQLQSMLTYLRVDSLIITGMVTSGCVRATVNDAFALNYRIVVPMECVADRSQLSHRVELLDMAAKYADVTTLDDVTAALRSAR